MGQGPPCQPELAQTLPRKDWEGGTWRHERPNLPTVGIDELLPRALVFHQLSSQGARTQV